MTDCKFNCKVSINNDDEKICYSGSQHKKYYLNNIPYFNNNNKPKICASNPFCVQDGKNISACCVGVDKKNYCWGKDITEPGIINTNLICNIDANLKNPSLLDYNKYGSCYFTEICNKISANPTSTICKKNNGEYQNIKNTKNIKLLCGKY